MNLTIHTDGGARGNPGPAGIAVVLRDADTGKLVHEAGYYIGKATNNVAEYSALIRALELAQSHQAVTVRIHSDSELMVKQITGLYTVKAPGLQELCQHAQRLLLQFDNWQIKHVYREQNQRADELVNMALDIRGDVINPGAQQRSTSDESTAGTPQVSEGGASGASGGSGGRADAGPRWTVTVLSRPEYKIAGGCEKGQVFQFGPTTPAGMCVFAAQAMFAESPVTGLDGQESSTTCHCPRCGTLIRIDMVR